jgi:hypothetical protein
MGLYSTISVGSMPQEPVTTTLGRVVDAHGQLARGEAAEHDRVHRAEPGTGQHRDHGLGIIGR